MSALDSGAPARGGLTAQGDVPPSSGVLAGKKLGFLLHLDSDLSPAESYRQAIELFVWAVG